MKAVKVGYVFNIFDDRDLKNISLKETSRKIEYDGKEYVLYAPVTYEDAQRVDMLLDLKGDLRVNDYKVKESTERVR